MKTIGVLTSGGDAPGMNAGMRAIVLSQSFVRFRNIWALSLRAQRILRKGAI